MPDTIIRVENLGKKYIINHQQEERSPYTTLRDVIASSAKSLIEKIQSPKPKIQSRYEEFWALKDVSFEVKKGEVIGIIGRNGAGKSTLLKILSRITEPTTGQISIKGRVASLLEVGTGFHPELTGRENIYLNGAILGMSKVEIKRKFDEIVAFAEVEKFLDTPVKRYSSGMYVRLAFAVAAHLEPEILVVDEVLAVGDAAFQKKCLGKMGDVAEKEGRTVLFVSHNMTAVKSLCQRGIWLNQGTIVEINQIDKVVSHYLETSSTSQSEQVWQNLKTAPGNEQVRLHRVSISSVINHQVVKEITVLTPIKIEFEYWNFLPNALLNLSFVLYNLEDTCIFNTVSEARQFPVGLVRGVCYIPENFLNNAIYRIRLLIVKDTSIPLLDLDNVAYFEVRDVQRQGNWYGKWIGAVRPRFNWDLELVTKTWSKLNNEAKL